MPLSLGSYPQGNPKCIKTEEVTTTNKDSMDTMFRILLYVKKRKKEQPGITRDSAPALRCAIVAPMQNWTASMHPIPVRHVLQKFTKAACDWESSFKKVFK